MDVRERETQDRLTPNIPRGGRSGSHGRPSRLSINKVLKGGSPEPTFH